MSRLLNRHLFFEKIFPTVHTDQMAGTSIQAKKSQVIPEGNQAENIAKLGEMGHLNAFQFIGRIAFTF